MTQAGLWLLPDEYLEAEVPLMGDMSRGLEYQRGRLFLTNRRVLRLLLSSHEAAVACAALEDVDGVELRRRERNPLWLGVGILFILGGMALAVSSLTVLPAVLSPLLMSLSLALIGLVLVLTYVGGNNADVIFTAGSQRIRCRVDSKGLEQVGQIVSRLFEAKARLAASKLSAGESGPQR